MSSLVFRSHLKGMKEKIQMPSNVYNFSENIFNLILKQFVLNY